MHRPVQIVVPSRMPRDKNQSLPLFGLGSCDHLLSAQHNI
jgi:hypothetical protein